jgi:amino acid transporter
MAVVDRDEQKLAELGYKQELVRAWSGFSNFAISFTIISVLAGCFTVYGQAWNNGGPIAISWAWPIICAFVLVIALCMAELASAYPTAGGPYWWAAKLGGPGWSWFTGWANVLGLVAVVASVGYGAATFGAALFNLWGVDVGVFDFGDSAGLGDIFALFVVILAIYALLNIYSSHLVALFNNISVFWHVLGVAVIIAVLVFVPDRHQDASFVFTDTINNSGFSGGSTTSAFFWFYVLPVGFLLTMYTQTGYDASAHVAEETHEAERKVARGLWQSVFWAAVFGWFVLLALTFAASDVNAINDGGGTSIAVIESALTEGWAEVVLLIATIGQIFCGMAGLTSASRTWYAFSRDRAIPGWRTWTRLDRRRVPVLSVLAVAAAALVITIPANWGNEAGIPWAFFAVVSVTTIGLYVAYVAPVYLRLRAGDRFVPGAWNLGRHYRWMNMVAVVWTLLMIVVFSLPFVPAGVPGNDEFDITSVNYAPVVNLLLLAAIWIWWAVSAKRRYHGPVRTLEFGGEGMELVEDRPGEPGEPPREEPPTTPTAPATG